MNQLVLSGTATLVLSGTGSSWYWGPKSSLRACFFALSGCSNFTTQKSFGFLLTHQAENCVGDDRQLQAASPVWLSKSHTLFAEPHAPPVGGIVEVRRFGQSGEPQPTVMLATRSDLDLGEQVAAKGATWLDHRLVERDPMPLAMHDGLRRAV